MESLYDLAEKYGGPNFLDAAAYYTCHLHPENVDKTIDEMESRWYDQKHVAPAYPFGYGLSYATFIYSDLNVKSTADGLNVSFTLTNTSDCDAEEVAQVYVAGKIKELKGFQRVALKAGERKVVTVPIRRSDLCHWDEATQTWVLEPDDITVFVGGSSDNLPLTSKAKIY